VDRLPGGHAHPYNDADSNNNANAHANGFPNGDEYAKSDSNRDARRH
jgi:hypothetical protein